MSCTGELAKPLGEGLHAFSCLFVCEGREPSQVKEAQLSGSVVNAGGLWTRV